MERRSYGFLMGPEQIHSMVKTAVEALGAIDILVNCAGVPQHDAAESTPLETWDRVIDINLRLTPGTSPKSVVTGNAR